jgi:phage tail P2-like protein
MEESPMINLNNIDLVALLPSSLKQDAFTVALAQAITEEIQIIIKEADVLLSENYPEALLDFIAYEKHVDYYDNSLPVEQKRELIRKADFFHRQKGTPAAVEDLITTLFDEGKVQEWFEYNGQPKTFRVVTNNSSVTAERAQEFIKALNSVKRFSATLDRVVITEKQNLPLYFGGLVHVGDFKVIKQVR